MVPASLSFRQKRLSAFLSSPADDCGKSGPKKRGNLKRVSYGWWKTYCISYQVPKVPELMGFDVGTLGGE